jgi:anti-sigma B factor antagonist
MRTLDLSTAHLNGATVVTVNGSVDAVTTPRLTEALEAELEAGNTNLVADFGGVEYVSSAGLRTILATVKRARAEGGDLRVAAVQAGVEKVFELSGFTTIVRFFAHVDEAVASYA